MQEREPSLEPPGLLAFRLISSQALVDGIEKSRFNVVFTEVPEHNSPKLFLEYIFGLCRN